MTDQQQNTQRRPIKLDLRRRLMMGVVGVAGAFGGSAAVFTRDVEAGPVAMLAIGALFLLISISGILPTRLKFGDNEAEWSEVVGDALETVLELVPIERRPEAIELLKKLSAVAPETTAPALSGVAFEEQVLAMLEKALIELNSQGGLTSESRAVRDGKRFDALIDGPHGKLAVEVKGYTRPIGRTMVQETETRAQSELSPEVTRVLLITRTRLTSAAQQYIQLPDVNVHHLLIDGAKDQRKLTEALKLALAP